MEQKKRCFTCGEKVVIDKPVSQESEFGRVGTVTKVPGETRPGPSPLILSTFSAAMGKTPFPITAGALSDCEFTSWQPRLPPR